MKLNREQVRKVAKLANLSISEKEEEIYGAQLSKILDYVDLLNSLDTNDVFPTYNVSGQINVMACDEVVEGLSQEEATKNGLQVKNGFFVTKGVFESE